MKLRSRIPTVRSLAILLLAVPAYATTLGETTFNKLASGSDVIVVGRVVRVVEVPAGNGALRVAEVEVLEWLKGAPRPQRLWYLATGTSGVDISHAVAGERALLFLRKGKIGALDEEVEARLAAPAFRKRVNEMTGGAPLLQLGWAGHGRMPLEPVEGVECARVDVYYIHLPSGTYTLPGSDPRFTDSERRVPLAALIGLIRRRLPPVDGEAPVFRLLKELDADTIVEPTEKAWGLFEEMGETAVPALLELLGDPAFPRRDTVAEALICLGGRELEALFEALRAEEAVRRRGAAFALAAGANAGLVGPDDFVIKGLLAAAADPDPEVRAHVVYALLLAGDDTCVAAAVAALSDKSERVRRAAVRALIRGRAGRMSFVMIEEYEPAKAEAALLPMAAHEDLRLRREVWEVLVHAAGLATLPAALKALEDDDGVVRVCAIRALGRIRPKRVIPFLESKDPWVRRSAAHALGVGKSAEAVGPLTKALGDPDGHVVEIAIEALGEIGGPAAAAVPALERLLEGKLQYHAKAAIEKIRPWTILRYQAFQVEPRGADDGAEALIDGLLNVGRTRDGLTNDSGGGIYLELTDDAFGRLVRLGPGALPAVLRHLDDARKTELEFPAPEPDTMGGMFLCRELMAPPGRADELKRIRDAFGAGVVTDWYEFSEGVDLDQGLEGHAVTVGDCCLAVLGQIVNRPYEAVRYQPSAITAVCSPTLEPRIAKAMRAAWGHGDPWQLLAQSLQDDFFTRGPGSSAFQAGAAARLCLYFPEHGGALVARRIAGLTFNPKKDGLKASHLFREVLKTGHPGARAAWMEFLDPARPRRVLRVVLAPVGRNPEPDVQERIRAIFLKTDDTRVMLECLDRLPRGAKEHFPRLLRAFREAEAEGKHRSCQSLLDAMIREDKKKALDVCREHMKAGYKQIVTVLGSLYWARDRDMVLALVPPLLDDLTLLRGHTPRGFFARDRRVCDLAADVVARTVEELEFTNLADFATRERQIAAIRKALGAR